MDRVADRKRKIYQHVATINLHGSSTYSGGDRKGSGYGQIGFEYDTSGLVYPSRSRRAFKITTGERWYALIAPRDHDVAWLVRRWKLDDVRHIEQVRWRVQKRLARAKAASAAVWRDAEKSGRFYSFGGLFSEPGFRVFNKRNQRWDADARQECDDAVTQLALIPTTEELDVGERLLRIDSYLMACDRTAFMLDELLAIAFQLRDHKSLAERRQAREQVVYCVNGRRYVDSFENTHGRYHAGRVWPKPDEIRFDL